MQIIVKNEFEFKSLIQQKKGIIKTFNLIIYNVDLKLNIK